MQSQQIQRLVNSQEGKGSLACANTLLQTTDVCEAVKDADILIFVLPHQVKLSCPFPLECVWGVFDCVYELC